jgi:hypothetical protein
MSSKSLNDASKEAKFTKSMSTTGRTQVKNARGANVKKNSLTVKLKPFLDAMLDKLAKNFQKLHQLVSFEGTKPTTASHNASPSETSHGNVVPDESGLVTGASKDALTLAVLNAQVADNQKSQNVDQLKILSKNLLLIQKTKSANVSNTNVFATLNFVTNQANAIKVSPLFTAWMLITVAKFYCTVFQKTTSVLEKSATVTGDTL